MGLDTSPGFKISKMKIEKMGKFSGYHPLIFQSIPSEIPSQILTKISPLAQFYQRFSFGFILKISQRYLDDFFIGFDK